MPGSAQSIAGINIVINTIVAEALSQMADALDAADDTDKCIDKLIKDAVTKHERIIFNGNGYSDEWCEEAARRGLPNLKTTVDALPEFVSDKSIKLFEKHGVFSPAEVESRYEILVEDYSKFLHIEMLTMLEMAKQEILPACLKYSNKIAKGLETKKSIGIMSDAELKLAKELSDDVSVLIEKIGELDKIAEAAPSENDYETAKYYKDIVIPAMNELRTIADKLETKVGKEYWPFPTYTDLLYKI